MVRQGELAPQPAHQNVNLIGSSDTYFSDLGYLHVTLHHCWYDQQCSERMPSVRFGRAHVYNNYLTLLAIIIVSARVCMHAECLVENNYFENIQNPWELLTTTGVAGKLRAEHNNVSFMDTSYGVRWVAGWYPGQSLIPGVDLVFAPPYTYSLETVGTVKGSVMAQAGNRDGVTEVRSLTNVASTFALRQNYPNPFNPTTTIEFDLPKESNIVLKIHDVVGQEIATLVSERLSAGRYQRQWRATGVSSGTYFYTLRAGEYVKTQKLLLLR